MTERAEIEEVAAAMRPIEGLPSEADWKRRAKFRAACRRSLYFHTKAVVCGGFSPNLLTERTFRDSSNWLQWVVTTKKRGSFEDPRDHAKSTRSTVAIPMWCAIQRPDEEWDAPDEVERALRFLDDHPHMRGVDSRLIIGSEAKSGATDWVRSSKTYWETSVILQWAFPELIWPTFTNTTYGRWSDEEYFLPGREMPTLRDGFLRSVGIESKESGGRGEGIIYDDLISEKSAESATELAFRWKWLRSGTQWLEHQDYNSPRGGFVLNVNNRWALDDPNSKIHDEMDDWAIWHRGASKCIVHGFGNCGRQRSDEPTECGPATTDEGVPDPIWPEMHPDLVSVRKDKGDFIYFTQWENNPEEKGDLDAGLMIPFRLEIRTRRDVEGRERRGWCVIIEPYAHNGIDLVKTAEVIPVTQLQHHLISIDPASAEEDSLARKAGKTARHCASWFSLDEPTGRVFWLDCRAGHWPPEVAIGHFYDTWYDAAEMLGFKPRIICERVGAQTFVRTALKLHAQAQPQKHVLDMRPEDMIPPARGVHKIPRIRNRLGWRLGQNQLYVRDGLLLPRVEARHFPTGTKDALDTEAQAESVYMEKHGGRADSAKLAARRRRQRRNRLAAARSTGAPI